MKKQLMLSPSFVAWLEDMKILEEELTKLLEERDQIKYFRAKTIEAEYYQVFGEEEKEVLAAFYRALRLRRILEFLQAKKNRQEKVEGEELEVLIEEELGKYFLKLEELLEKMAEAKEWSSAESFSEEEAKEFKTLYRSLLKALHPDFHPEQGEREKELFLEVLKAYQAGDLEKLRQLQGLLKTLQRDWEAPSSEEEGQKKKAALEALLEDLKEEMKDLKASYPFTLLDYLEEPEERHKELKEQKFYYLDCQERYQKELEEWEGWKNVERKWLN